MMNSIFVDIALKAVVVQIVYAALLLGIDHLVGARKRKDEKL